MSWRNTDIVSLANNIYDYLHDGYEMWVRDVNSDGIIEEHVNYAIVVEADNMCEDGWPLIIRMVSKSLVLIQDRDSAAYGIKAYKFYRKYFARDVLESYFGTMIGRYEKIIARQKRVR